MNKKLLQPVSWLLALSLLLAACGNTVPTDSAASGSETEAENTQNPSSSGFETLPWIGPSVKPNPTESASEPGSEEPLSTEETESLPPASETPEESVTEPATETPTEPTEPSTSPVVSGKLICIDAGHQGQANSDPEPIGPGSSETKVKVTSGTQGRTTGVAEYVVNLQVALKLQKILEERGYKVIMTRTTHDVDISNAERAQMANEAGVDAFVRIHCNGVDNTEINGILAMCQTIVDEMCNTTGAKNMGVQETDSMTGINWCEVPTALVEMGFMTNPEEDQKLVDDAYQDLLAEGIANGLDAYFGIQR